MKILQISPQIPLPLDNGGRISIYGITKGLAERNYKIYFLTYSNDKIDASIISELNKICKPHLIPYDTKNNFFKAIINLFSLTPYNISKYKSKKFENYLIKLLQKEKFDLIHIDHLHMAWCINVIRKVSDAPVVLREHNLELKIMKRFYERNNNLILKFYAYIQFLKFKNYEPKMCSKFNKCIMITKNDENTLLKLNSKIHTIVIPAGINKSLLSIEKKNIIQYSLFHIGDLNWLPNLEGLNWFIKNIFPQVIEIYPNTKLFIYGKGIEKVNILKKIERNIKKIGYVQDIWNETNDKQVLIVPLKVGSGLRIKIIEMIAAGNLVITTSIGKEGLDFEDGKHLFIADNEMQFVQKITDIFSGKIDSNKIINNAKSFVAENYLWGKVISDFDYTYKDLMKKIN